MEEAKSPSGDNVSDQPQEPTQLPPPADDVSVHSVRLENVGSKDSIEQGRVIQVPMPVEEDLADQGGESNREVVSTGEDEPNKSVEEDSDVKKEEDAEEKKISEEENGEGSARDEEGSAKSAEAERGSSEDASHSEVLEEGPASEGEDKALKIIINAPQSDSSILDAAPMTGQQLMAELKTERGIVRESLREEDEEDDVFGECPQFLQSSVWVDPACQRVLREVRVDAVGENKEPWNWDDSIVQPPKPSDLYSVKWDAVLPRAGTGHLSTPGTVAVKYSMSTVALPSVSILPSGRPVGPLGVTQEVEVETESAESAPEASAVSVVVPPMEIPRAVSSSIPPVLLGVTQQVSMDSPVPIRSILSTRTAGLGEKLSSAPVGTSSDFKVILDPEDKEKKMVMMAEYAAKQRIEEEEGQTSDETLSESAGTIERKPTQTVPELLIEGEIFPGTESDMGGRHLRLRSDRSSHMRLLTVSESVHPTSTSDSDVRLVHGSSTEPCFPKAGLQETILSADIKEYCVPLRVEEGDDGDKCVAVEFSSSQGRLFSKNYNMQASILELRKDIADFFSIQLEDVFDVMMEDEAVEDSSHLASITQDEQVNLSVRVTEPPKKPFLGGYRHSTLGIELHHAVSQTGPSPSKSGLVSRVTQTIRTKKRQVGPKEDKATQMPRPDLYLSTIQDKILTADGSRFITNDQLEQSKELQKKVRIIQNNFRAYLMRRMVSEMRKDYKKLKDSEEKKSVVEEEAEEAEEKPQEIESKMETPPPSPSPYPTTKQDFATLYSLVEKWRRAETTRICQTNSDAARRAKLSDVLEKEVVLIRAIDQQLQRVRVERAGERQMAQLEKCAQPIVFDFPNGKTVSVETLNTARAKELKALHSELKSELPPPERIQVLLKLREAACRFESPNAEELSRLAMRECALLRRNADPESLRHLRESILLVFGDIICQPGTSGLQTRDKNLDDYYRCQKCHAFKKPEDFPLHSRVRTVTQCRGCAHLDNAGRRRADMLPYRQIMDGVRKEEQKRSAYSSVAFIMQEEDFKALVVLWHAQSVLTGKAGGVDPAADVDPDHPEYGVLSDLRLPRWQPDEDWAPWNCIMLSAAEAVAHEQLADPGQAYALELRDAVRLRHLQARKVFHKLKRSNHVFRATSALEIGVGAV